MLVFRGNRFQQFGEVVSFLPDGFNPPRLFANVDDVAEIEVRGSEHAGRDAYRRALAPFSDRGLHETRRGYLQDVIDEIACLYWRSRDSCREPKREYAGIA